MPIRILLPLAGAVVAAGLSACGSAGSKAASRPAPPTPIVLSALAGSAGLSVSPERFGAGPVLLTATNQGALATVLTVARRGHPGAIAHTAPIRTGGVTQLKIDLGRGTYVVSARGPGSGSDAARSRSRPGAASAVIHVGRHRPSGGNGVLEP